MKINVLVDWGESFVDENGNFYCGTTQEQKEKAAQINEGSDLTIYLVDIHSEDSSEFIENGGLYPSHNLLRRDRGSLDGLLTEDGKTTSPELTGVLQERVKNKKAGLIVPRHVYFQNYDGGDNPQPAFSLEDVEETFGVPRLDKEELFSGNIEYIVNAKHLFDGTAMQSTSWMGDFEGVPTEEENVFTLLKQKYGQGEDLEINLTGVVMGICVYQTASGIKQILPKSEVNIIADACTHLVYAPLGIADEDTGDFVAEKMCKQIGVNYMTTEKYLRGKNE
jgi:hypothetical protein